MAAPAAFGVKCLFIHYFEIFLSHSAENFCRGILYCCFNFGYRENLDKRGGGGGVSRLSVESFLSHSAENFRRGILYCCINFGYRKILEKRGVSKFYVEIFLSHSAENSVGGSFTVVLISGIEKVWIRGGGYQVFP